MRYQAISALNDMLGGVEVVVLHDFHRLNMSEGQTVTLYGNDACEFLHYRDVNVFDSATDRLDRDKVYLKSFMAKVYDVTKNNITFPVSLYKNISNYIVTSLSIDEMTCLATELLKYDIKSTKAETLAGNEVMGEVFEEFYIDEGRFQQQLIDIYYNPA